MKVKTSELSGVQLDYAVAVALALALGGNITIHSPSQRRFDVPGGIHCSTDGCTYGPRSSCHDVEEYSPSTDWSICGPLIKEFDLLLNRITPSNEHWKASPHKSWSSGIDKDPKIAICRAVVSAKLGDEVEIPDELMERKQ